MRQLLLPCSAFGDTIINERMVISVSYQYNARLIPEPDGRWTAEIPALPGCVTWGNTREEALGRIKEAIELYLEVLIEEGKPIPSDESTFTRVEVAI